MSMILGMVSGGIGQKLAIYGGIALAVLLAVFFIYRAGGKAAEGAANRRALVLAADNRKTRERIENEITKGNRSDDPGRSSAERLRNKWARD